MESSVTFCPQKKKSRNCYCQKQIAVIMARSSTRSRTPSAKAREAASSLPDSTTKKRSPKASPVSAKKPPPKKTPAKNASASVGETAAEDSSSQLDQSMSSVSHTSNVPSKVAGGSLPSAPVAHPSWLHMRGSCMIEVQDGKSLILRHIIRSVLPLFSLDFFG